MLNMKELGSQVFENGRIIARKGHQFSDDCIEVALHAMAGFFGIAGLEGTDNGLMLSERDRLAARRGKKPPYPVETGACRLDRILHPDEGQGV